MASKVGKLNPEWILETRKDFLQFLEFTNFPHPERNGDRDSAFLYPEWLIMFIVTIFYLKLALFRPILGAHYTSWSSALISVLDCDITHLRSINPFHRVIPISLPDLLKSRHIRNVIDF